MRLFALLLALAFLGFSVGSAVGQERAWTSADGKKKIQAKFVSANESSVTIKRVNGKELTVPLTKFSEADREFVKEKLAEAGNKEIEAEIRKQVLRFYQGLRKEKRDDLKPLLTKAAQAKFSASTSFFEGITGADKGQKPSVKKIEIDDATALANVSVKIGGKFRKIEIGLLKESKVWLLSTLTYETDDGDRKMMKFADAQEVDPEAEAEKMAEEEAQANSDREPRNPASRGNGNNPRGDQARDRERGRETGGSSTTGPNDPPPFAAPPPAEESGNAAKSDKEEMREEKEQTPEAHHGHGRENGAGHGHGHGKEPAPQFEEEDE